MTGGLSDVLFPKLLTVQIFYHSCSLLIANSVWPCKQRRRARFRVLGKTTDRMLDRVLGN
jgi:hypothetical protein